MVEIRDVTFGATKGCLTRAAAFAEYGGPEVLRLMELETPQAGPGQVRVRVKAAGVVDQVGSGVTGFAAGAEVLGFGQLNCYAEYLVISAEQITPKPEDMP